MDRIQAEVQQVFAEITRYPVDILDPDADLEEELGIDSVKRAELIAVLQERYHLPETLDVPPESINTIANIAALIGSLVADGSHRTRPTDDQPLPRPNVKRDGGPASTAPTGTNGAHYSGNGRTSTAAEAQWSRPQIEHLVIDTVAEVTRYPKDILTLDADLEEDLGIDSVKRAEILAVLSDRFGLPEAVTAAPSELQITTINGLVAAAYALITEAAAAPAAEGRDQRQPSFAVASTAPAVSPARRGVGSEKPFAGKVAFVTGSGHGIGKAIACALGGLGADVIVNSFHSRQRGDETTEAIRSAGGRAEHLWGSVANPAHLEKVFSQIEARYGGLDLLVSNASNGILAPLKDVNETHWDRAFRTNVVALHRGAMLAAPLMRKRGGGKIVALSTPGAQRYVEYFGCMGPVKAALESLVRYLAVELGPENIQINAVSAGPVYGELLTKYPDHERLIPYWESLSANRRLVEDSDVVGLVQYLLSPSADGITGSVLLVDCGGSQRV